ncbi:MAG: transcriptional regulator [Proteobacteria bacterium]|nr:transcriptional regulator [Pseudomonadota bacterium]
MRPFRWHLALPAAVLAGCAAAPSPYPADLESRFSQYSAAAACCDDPGAFPWVPLPGSGTVEFVIGSESPAFEFQSGLSRFAAFRLPETQEPFKVQVKSFFDGPSGPDGSVFYPVLAMMDDAFIVTRVSSLENIRLDQALATPGGKGGLAVVAPFDPGYSRERYLVVFTPAVLLGAPPAERREGDVLTSPALEWVGRRNEDVVTPSPFGRLRITVAPANLPDPG